MIRRMNDSQMGGQNCNQKIVSVDPTDYQVKIIENCQIDRVGGQKTT